MYRMKNKEDMPKIIKQLTINAYGKGDHNFRHGAGEIDE